MLAQKDCAARIGNVGADNCKFSLGSEKWCRNYCATMRDEGAKSVKFSMFQKYCAAMIAPQCGMKVSSLGWGQTNCAAMIAPRCGKKARES